MPLYEYQCRDCRKVTDVRHGFDDAPPKECPACGGTLERRFNAAGIVFKGSGFYVNDSRKSSGGESKQTSSGETKSDSTEKQTSSSETKSDPGPSEKKSDSGSSSEKKSDSSTSSSGSSSGKSDTAAA